MASSDKLEGENVSYRLSSELLYLFCLCFYFQLDLRATQEELMVNREEMSNQVELSPHPVSSSMQCLLHSKETQEALATRTTMQLELEPGGMRLILI